MMQLSPTIPLQTPFGPAVAWFVIESGDERDLQWVTVIDSGEHMNEIWVWRNREVRAVKNVTMGRVPA